MSKEKFDINQQAVIVPVVVEADGIKSAMEFLVDTGTWETLISEKAIRSLGYTPVDSIEDIKIQTVVGAGMAYRYVIESISALGLTRSNIKIMSLHVQSGAGVDGLLGLDFFQNTELNIDFKRAVISVIK